MASVHMTMMITKCNYLKYTVSVLLLAVACFLSGCATNAITGRSQLMLVTEQSAISQSTSAYSSLISGLSQSGKLSKDLKLIARVQDITNRLITQAVTYRPATKNWKWGVTVIDEPETVNAFCMAGGKMAIYTGLINKVDPSDDELAQVMGHEISHALASHSAEKMSVRLAAGLAVVAITASANQNNRQTAHDVSSLAALTLVTLPNSRVAENEADTIGIELAAKAGYNPHAAVTLWEKMMKVSGQTSRFDFLSTHPASPKRIESLAALEVKMLPIYDAGKANRKLAAENWGVSTQSVAIDTNGLNLNPNESSIPRQSLQGQSGTSSKSTTNLAVFKLRELNKLRKEGVISEGEFIAKKHKLLEQY